MLFSSWTAVTCKNSGETSVFCEVKRDPKCYNIVDTFNVWRIVATKL